MSNSRLFKEESTTASDCSSKLGGIITPAVVRMRGSLSVASVLICALSLSSWPVQSAPAFVEPIYWYCQIPDAITGGGIVRSPGSSHEDAAAKTQSVLQGYVAAGNGGSVPSYSYLGTFPGWSYHKYGYDVVSGDGTSGVAEFWFQTACPDGYRGMTDSDNILISLCALRANENPPEPISVGKHAGECERPGEFVGNPISISTGNKFLKEVDIPAMGISSLELVRYYNSLIGDSHLFGATWRTNYSRYLKPPVVDYYGDANFIQVFRPDGKMFYFFRSDGAWVPDNDVRYELVDNADGWNLITSDGSVESYDSLGLLQSITTLEGEVLSMQYNMEGNLSRVSSSLGRHLDFEYEVSDSSRVIAVTDHVGRRWQYAYGQGQTLEYVIIPDETALDDTDNPRRQYHYNEPGLGVDSSAFAYLLTGVTDERGIRYATYEYDASGRAISSYHAGNTEKITIEYDPVGHPEGTRIVTNSLGQSSVYSSAVQLGRIIVNNITGPGCSTCGGGDTSYVYDPANNDLLSKTEYGLTTAYGAYDAKGQYGYKIEAQGTVDERRTDYTYDSRFYNKITSITESSVNPAGSKVTSYVYDAFGNVTSDSISGLAPDGQNGWVPVNRTTIRQYAGPLNQISFVDGPRTDVSDYIH